MPKLASHYLPVSVLGLITLAGCDVREQGGPAAPAAPSVPAPTTRAIAMSKDAEAKGLAEPFKGVTTGGKVVAGLFPIKATGVSTEPVRKATLAFLDSLTPDQRAKTTFKVDDDEWRKWMNQHFYVRQGVSFAEMTPRQREAAFAMLGEGLSAKGLKLTRDVMRLNETLAELKNNFEEYGEGRYWLTVMGTPSEKEPWGFQLDGHHLIVNYFVLGDQVVMTPSFWGSEPTVATAGKHKGIRILDDEQDKALAFVNALAEAQRAKAVIKTSKTGNDNVGEAFKDNVVLDYAGVKASELSAAHKEQLLELVGLYVNNTRDGHAKVKLDEVRRHLDDTYFAWIGKTEPGGVFYYRVHSPVVLIEFDHQKPIALGDRSGPPGREHIHALIRTPNGNDYGKDLLRQHYERHKH
ncbi:MAG TPA: DUF3500 domain-containing protein [Tepidisphaeraceae bacterium]|nr:DUF3500 domain-containing protein [Tepidisphaeraceae bacterium]